LLFLLGWQSSFAAAIDPAVVLKRGGITMASARAIAILLALLIPFTASAATVDKKTALKELEELSIAFTSEDFLDRVRESDVVAVQLFLAAGMDPNTEPESDWAAIMTAAYEGHASIVKMLLQYGAEMREDALGNASSSGDVDTVKILLDAGTDPNVWLTVSPGCPPCSPLVRAAEQGHTGIVKLLLESGAKDNYSLNEALVRTAEHGDFEMVVPLLDKGADANYENDRGHTALMSAAGRGDVELVWFLLDKGAEAAVVGRQGMTALHGALGSAATLREKTEIATLLLNNGADANAGTGYGRKPIHLAARGRPDVTRMLLDMGADANAVDEFGETPLMYAARSGGMDVVIELLKHGADIHATNKEGETALTLAQEEGRVEIERLLEIPNSARQIAWQNRETERKGEPKLRIRSESEIARIAQKKLAEQSEIAPRKIRRPIIKGDSDIARNARKGLARRKIPFNRDEFVNMARQGDISTMKLFLAAGINPNVEDNLFHRETALMVAAGKGHTEIVKLLLEMGANPDIQNDFNGTALLNAAKEGHTESLRLILEADLEIDAKDIHGATALCKKIRT
jgi:ankyrin repeat protein